jgi:23S rRNA (cytosine1962-C5)-methyltransferase
MIVMDPPKFAPTAAHAERAARAYKDINLLAFKLLTAGGLLATFSCSGGISADLFQKIVAGAALDANVDAQIVARLGASADHPVALNFPEGDYLKGLLLRRA